MRLLSSILLLVLLLNAIIFTSLSARAQVPATVPTQAAAKPGAQEAIEPVEELKSPASTVRHFYSSLARFQKGDDESLDKAIAALDLSKIPEFSIKGQGRNLALRLLAILNRTNFDMNRLPGSGAVEPVVLRDDEKGHVSLEKIGPNWKFSQATVDNIPTLYHALKNEKVVRTIFPEAELEASGSVVRNYVPDALKGRALWMEYWQILMIVCGILFSYLVRALSFHLFAVIIGFFVKKFAFLSNKASVDRFASLLAFLAALYTFHFFLYLADLSPVLYARLIRVLEIIKIITYFILTTRLIDLVAEVIHRRPGEIFGKADRVLIPLGATVLKAIVVFIGIALLAGLFNFNIAGLVAGLGIGGLAVALAAKDTIENLFGSITVLVDRPFKVGDLINIEGATGSVEEIGLRSTRLRTPENSLLTIPNSKLISVMVDNLGARRNYRARTSLCVTHETSIEQLELFCNGIRQILEKHPKARSDYFVNFNEFAPSSLNIILQVYFTAASYVEYLNTQQEFFLNIIRLAKFLNVEFAYPVQKNMNVDIKASGEAKVPDAESFREFLGKLTGGAEPKTSS